MIAHHLSNGGSVGTQSDTEGNQTWAAGEFGLTDAAGFLVKLDFMRNYTDRPRRRFRVRTNDSLVKQRIFVRGWARIRVLHTDRGLCGWNVKLMPEDYRFCYRRAWTQGEERREA